MSIAKSLAAFILLFFALIGSNVFAQENQASRSAQDDATGQRPNVLFFFTDDESWLEHSAYGWSKLPTPNFDRVAKSGVLFSNAYASAPSCAPSRASVLTGRNFWELEQGAFIQAYLPKKFPIYPVLMSEAGYQVGQTGKVWGPGVFPNAGWQRELVAGTKYENQKVPKAEQVKWISTNDYAGNFSDFLKSKDPKEPFCFFAGTTEPHSNWDENNYKRLEKEFGFALADVSMPKSVEDTPEKRKIRANFLYEVCYADRQLGRMLDQLEAIGGLDNTLVVVTSDNGTGISSGGDESHPVGKASHHEWGTHEPLAIMWPKRVPAGRVVTDFVNFADFAPTFLEAAGIAVPKSMTGRSLIPLLTTDRNGRIDPTRDAVFTGMEWHGEMDPESKTFRAVRDDEFYYAAMYENVDDQNQPLVGGQETTPAAEALYDCKNDPWQLKNLAANPAWAKQKQNLASRLHAYGVQTGDPRATGEMELFRKLRRYVQDRKTQGYGETLRLPAPTQ